jgi:hypothetical protein
MLGQLSINEAFDVAFFAQQFHFSRVAEMKTGKAWQSIVLKIYQIF